MMSIAWRFALLLLTLLSPLVPVRAESTRQDPAPPNWQKRFADSAAEGFARWDLDHDGYINLRESTRALAKTDNKGDAAAAIAALHELLRSTRWRINAINLQQIREPARRPLEMTQWEPVFQRMVAAIEKPASEIFMNGAPKLDGVRQGREGDCYLLAVLGAQLNKNPALVKAMISPREGGVLVDFQSLKVQVPPLTDAERALAATSGDQGTWLSLIEKAWGSMEVARRGGGLTNPLDGGGGGGNPANVIRILTGRKTISRQLVIEDGINDVINDLDYSLRLCKEDKRLACAGTDARRLPPGMVPRHAYAILDYNPRTRLVTMWNPWGFDRAVLGEPGLQTGYATKSGRFEIPITDFVRVFDMVFIESASKVGDD